jgi:galactonate dehydratase
MGGHTLSRGKEDVGRYVQHDHYRAIYIREAQTFMVKITTDDGFVGWGETQAGAVPEVLTILVKELIEPRLLGADPFDREKLRDLLYDQMRERGHESGFYVDAVSACDIALWDLIGRATDRPIHQLLGGARRDRLPCYVSGVPADSVDEQIEAIEGWLERGFNRFKISLGFGVRCHSSCPWTRAIWGLIYRVPAHTGRPAPLGSIGSIDRPESRPRGGISNALCL